MRVLITEDSPAIRERLWEMLNRIPCVELVGQVDRDAEVVRNIYTLRPDVVILSFALAKDNLDVLRQIRMQSLRVRVIVMTNNVHSLYRKLCIDLGADHFLDKSRDIGKLSGLLAVLADEAAPENGLETTTGN